MISEFAIIKQRKEIAKELKETMTLMNESDEWLEQGEKMLEAVRNAFLMIRVLDWTLYNKELDFTTFCKETDESISKEFELDKFGGRL